MNNARQPNGQASVTVLIGFGSTYRGLDTGCALLDRR